MKPLRVLFALALSVSFLAVDCDKNDDVLIPKSGRWTYNKSNTKVEFFVSEDGTKICSTGSPLENEACIITEDYHYDECYSTNVTVTCYYYGDVEIIDMEFDHYQYDREVVGEFTSGENCTGEVDYDVNCVYPAYGSFDVFFTFNASHNSNKEGTVGYLSNDSILSIEYDTLTGRPLKIISMSK